MMSMMPYYTVSRKPKASRSERSLSPFGDEFFRAFFGESAMTGMKVDVQDKGDSYLLEADLPGVQKENVTLSVENGVLTIAVERKEETEEEQARSYVCRERRISSMSRSFSLEGVNEDGITAEYIDGVLHLTLPKAVQPEEKVRNIEIK